jgi:preprotein translocase subunit SecE
MSEKEYVTSNQSDTFKWALVGTLFLAGVGANFYFSDIAIPIRLIGWLILTCVLGLLALQTNQGKRAWEFGKLAQVELRKVNWPSRDETIKVTLVVMLMVFVVAIFIWLMDSSLIWVMEFLTGRRG